MGDENFGDSAYVNGWVQSQGTDQMFQVMGHLLFAVCDQDIWIRFPFASVNKRVCDQRSPVDMHSFDWTLLILTELLNPIRERRYPHAHLCTRESSGCWAMDFSDPPAIVAASMSCSSRATGHPKSNKRICTQNICKHGLHFTTGNVMIQCSACDAVMGESTSLLPTCTVYIRCTQDVLKMFKMFISSVCIAEIPAPWNFHFVPVQEHKVRSATTKQS